MRRVLYIGLVISFDLCLNEPVPNFSPTESDTIENSESSMEPTDSPGNYSDDEPMTTIDNSTMLLTTIGNKAEFVTTEEPHTTAAEHKHFVLENFHFIVYAAKVIQTIHSDPKPENLETLLKKYKKKGKVVNEVIQTLDEETQLKLDRAKTEEVKLYQKLANEMADVMANYIDFIHPNLFTDLDLYLVSKEVNHTRDVFEDLITRRPRIFKT